MKFTLTLLILCVTMGLAGCQAGSSHMEHTKDERAVAQPASDTAGHAGPRRPDGGLWMDIHGLDG
jgi:hypothetical protein